MHFAVVVRVLKRPRVVSWVFFGTPRHPRFSISGDCDFLVYFVILYINICVKKLDSINYTKNLGVLLSFSGI